MQPIAKYVALVIFPQISKIRNEISEFESPFLPHPILLSIAKSEKKRAKKFYGEFQNQI